jgi:hypothetical protein
LGIWYSSLIWSYNVVQNEIFGYETQEPAHALLEGCQQQCSYDIDRMDEPMCQLKFTALVQHIKCKANYHC